MIEMYHEDILGLDSCTEGQGSNPDACGNGLSLRPHPDHSETTDRSDVRIWHLFQSFVISGNENNLDN